MFERLRRGFFVGVVLLFMLCLGFATPALASPEDKYDYSDAKLNAVIIAPNGTNVSGDKFVFHFAGSGEVTADVDDGHGNIPVYSDGVGQDNTTIKDGDYVPPIGDVNGNVELQVPTTLTELNGNNSLTEGELCQAVVQKSLADILIQSGILVKNNENDADVLSNYHVEGFQHAGVYTYEITESSATAGPDKAYVITSQAKYRLRIYVKNATTGLNSVLDNKDLAIDGVTVELMMNDDGSTKDDEDHDITGKVNPTNPTTDASGKITGIEANKLAGDANGRNVPGFTFANEYITSGPFQVKKLYDGDHSDRTKYSTVELAVRSSVSPNASGGVLTYKIDGDGIDQTDKTQGNANSAGDRLKLDGVEENISQRNDYMVKFNDSGWCYIKADLKEGSSIQITGEFGPIDENGKRETLCTNGLLQGQTYCVIERNPHDYRPNGYTYVGADPNADPRKYVQPYAQPFTPHEDYPITRYLNTDEYEINATEDSELAGSNLIGQKLREFDLFMKGNTTGNATTIFVVNNIDESKVSTTGIFVDNLPYILMIGVPLVVFTGMFVAKRRGNAA